VDDARAHHAGGVWRQSRRLIAGCVGDRDDRERAAVPGQRAAEEAGGADQEAEELFELVDVYGCEEPNDCGRIAGCELPFCLIGLCVETQADQPSTARKPVQGMPVE
jgi:hypothetical protein